MTSPTPANAPRAATLEMQILTLGWTFLEPPRMHFVVLEHTTPKAQP